MKKEWIDLLLRSFDNELSKTESVELEKALKDSPSLQKEKMEFLKTRSLFTNFSITPAHDFVGSVLQRIENEEFIAKYRITHFLSTIYPKAVAACALLLVGFTAYIYMSEGNLDTETLAGISDLSPEEAFSYLLEE